MHTWTEVPSTQLTWVWPTKPGSLVRRRRSYHQWRSMIWVSPGVIQYSFTDLGRMEGWAGLAARVGREICWYHLDGESNPESNRARMVAQWFIHYATAAKYY